MTHRRSGARVLVMAMMLMLPGALGAQEFAVNEVKEPVEVEVVADAPTFEQVLQAEIQSLMDRSPTFRAAVEPLLMSIAVNGSSTIPGNHVARVYPATGPNGITTIFFDRVKMQSLSPAERDVVLAHEFYGHAVPQILTGRACEDPLPGQRYRLSCVSQRESVILKELGMRPRLKYSI